MFNFKCFYKQQIEINRDMKTWFIFLKPAEFNKNTWRFSLNVSWQNKEKR